MSILSGCLRDAQKYGLIEENPCPETAWKLPQKNLWEKQDWLSEEKLETLEFPVLQYQNKEGYPEGLFYQLMLYAGLTVSEAAALRWGDTDLEKRTLRIRYYAEEDICRETTGRRRRTVPVPEILARRMRQTKEIYRPEKESFVTTGEREMTHLDRMRAHLYRRCAGLGMGRITPRMLRDTYAIRAVQSGATSDTIAELLGFASPQQVIRRYMPKNQMDKQSLVNQMYPEK